MGIHTQPVVAEWVELLTGERDLTLPGAPACLFARCEAGVCTAPIGRKFNGSRKRPIGDDAI
jgi:hypothetical protein